MVKRYFFANFTNGSSYKVRYFQCSIEAPVSSEDNKCVFEEKYMFYFLVTVTSATLL